jgi:Reverse transcriptase (RNA-dependent DNA polymerase)
MNDKPRNKPATPRKKEAAKKESPASPATKTSKLATSIKAAVKNIATFGDTDIFPFSFEQHIFHDQPTLIQNALELIHADFEAQLAQNPPDNINTLAPVGYTGYRWASQLDPLWNAYYLSLIIEMGPAIEGARIPVSEETIFSYRFMKPTEDGGIFDTNVNWRAFMEKSQNVASLKSENGDSTYPFVLVCDISDFYSRIYHHRIENALKWLKTKPETVKRIVDILQVFSGTVSYGLPVGGPASRLLAELALNSVDKLLRGEGIRYCRFVDDYRIFCTSKEEAYQRLIFLSEKLFNEGLSLQKNKTRILTSKEFLDETKLLIKSDQIDEEKLSEEDKLLRLSIRFDPYSDTRVDDYKNLKEQVAKVDVAGILGRELEKTRIDPIVTKQAISAIRVLESDAQKEIIGSLLQIENLHTLAPVFPRLMTVLRGLYLDLEEATQDLIDFGLSALIKNESHVIQVDLNLAYAIQVMRRRCTQKTEALFVQIFRKRTSPLVRREIVIAWAGWQHNHSLTDLKKNFGALSKWERRAFIMGSYILTDEGKFWRDHNKKSFDPLEVVVRDWFAKRMNENPNVPL